MNALTILVSLLAFAVAAACFWRVAGLAAQVLKRGESISAVMPSLVKALILLIVALIVVVTALAGFEIGTVGQLALAG